MTIDWDIIREQDNDNTTAEVIRQAIYDKHHDVYIPAELMRLIVYAVANAGSREHQSTAANYDPEVAHAAKLEADAIITRIWADMWDDRKDAAAQHKYDSRD